MKNTVCAVCEEIPWTGSGSEYGEVKAKKVEGKNGENEW